MMLVVVAVVAVVVRCVHDAATINYNCILEVALLYAHGRISEWIIVGWWAGV